MGVEGGLNEARLTDNLSFIFIYAPLQSSRAVWFWQKMKTCLVS